MLKKLLTICFATSVAMSTAWTPLASASESPLLGKIRQVRGYAARKLLRSFHTAQTSKKEMVLDFYRRSGKGSKISVKAPLRFQTGPYKRLFLTDTLFRTKCLKELVWSAEQLNSHFPEFSFQLDGRIQNCKNLEKGVQRIIANKSKVRANVSRFHTPMHTIYLTNRTKFNHHQVGKMGLYVNVNKSREIQRRLVDFRVGVNDITHERSQVF
ncbi:MAG: hypothetical protein HRT45_05475 [Bdellovibrionales bacterium]|nr:hypothetical protein [Bdellovibrionales bacterium]